ncbi:MAG: PepSY domain-containing protein [Gemmatimonadaceae bacterium]
MKNVGLVSALVVTLAAPLAAQTVTVKEEKPGLLKKATVTKSAAIATAQAKLPKAKLASAEIEQEDGKLIYSFDFKTAGKSGIDEVNVDAMTGKLVGGVEHESPAAEKREAKADSSKAAKKKP